MDTDHPVRGLWCAMLTPVDKSGGVDHGRLVDHARRLLAQGVDGVAPFGTTGEGQSFGVGDRAAGLSALLAAGIPADRLVAATGCAALSETITLTRHGVQSGCAGCLVLPPFFFKEPADDGLFAWYARVIEAVGDARLRVLLYHIPQVSGTAERKVGDVGTLISCAAPWHVAQSGAPWFPFATAWPCTPFA